MKQKILFLFSIILLISFVECRRIAGGWPVEPGVATWHVKLEPSNGSFRRLCGGALIRYNWVLTAGQCLQNARDVIVRLGVVDRLAGIEPAIFWVRDPDHIIVHEAYFEDPANSIYTNDIGLVYLEESTENIFNITDSDGLKLITAIPLPKDSLLDPVGKIGVATGFGFYMDGPDAIQSMKLRMVDMVVMDLDECMDFHGIDKVSPGKLCTDTTGGQSTCIGDEGAPLVSVVDGFDTALIGIGSTALEYCQKEEPAIFTSVMSYLDWILEEIDEAPVTDPPTTTEDPNVTPPPPDNGKCNCVCNCYTCPAPSDPIKPKESKPKMNYFWNN